MSLIFMNMSIRNYTFDFFFRILGSIKMKLSQILLLQLMKNIPSLLFALLWQGSCSPKKTAGTRFRFNVDTTSYNVVSIWNDNLWHRCFPVNLAKFLRTPSLQNTTGRLFLALLWFWLKDNVFFCLLWRLLFSAHLQKR